MPLRELPDAPLVLGQPLYPGDYQYTALKALGFGAKVTPREGDYLVMGLDVHIADHEKDVPGVLTRLARVAERDDGHATHVYLEGLLRVRCTNAKGHARKLQAAPDIWSPRAAQLTRDLLKLLDLCSDRTKYLFLFAGMESAPTAADFVHEAWRIAADDELDLLGKHHGLAHDDITHRLEFAIATFVQNHREMTEDYPDGAKWRRRRLESFALNGVDPTERDVFAALLADAGNVDVTHQTMES